MSAKISGYTPKSLEFRDTDLFDVSKRIPQTSGVLLVGKRYTIEDYNAGDDFSNVATVVSGTINTTGCVFDATGTTPTTYTNGSTLSYFATQSYTFEELKSELGIGSKAYKALLSQAAPIASQTSGTFTVGMIVSITTYAAGDDFSNWNLISGTDNTTGAVYQVTVAAPTDWTNSSDLSYDGAPFIVSLDSNGDLNPLFNKVGSVVLTRNATGNYSGTLAGAFVQGKTFFKEPQQRNIPISVSYIRITWNSVNDFVIETYDSLGAPSDDILYYTSIEIEIFP